MNSVSFCGKNVTKFIAGNLKNFYTVWQKATSDRVILDNIKNGLKIDFKERPGISPATKIPHSEQEIKVINTEIKKLLAKGVIIECERDKKRWFYFFNFHQTKKRWLLENHIKI